MRNRKPGQLSQKRTAARPDQADEAESMRRRNYVLGLLVVIIMIIFYFDAGGCATILGRYVLTGMFQ